MHIEVDSHTHTIASGHAYSTLGENVAAAAAGGIRLLAITEHGPAMPGAPHIWYFRNMRVVPRILAGVGILRGVEANIINFAGEIDIDDDLHQQFDIVLASLHEPVIAPSTRTVHTDAVVKAMASGKIDVFAHGGNPIFPIDVDTVAQAARDFKVLVEINNSSFTSSRAGSEKNCTALAEAVARYDGRLTFGSDAHIACNVGRFAECITFVKKIGFPEVRILSTSCRAFIAFLQEKNKQNLGALTQLTDLNGQSRLHPGPREG
jgi:putative hydrolase